MLLSLKKRALAIPLALLGVIVAFTAGPISSAAALPPFIVTPRATPSFAPSWAHTPLDRNAPDPAVIRVGSRYYAYTTGTTWGNHIGILTSTSPTSAWNSISGNQFASSAFPSVPFASPIRPWQVAGTANAPGVFHVGGRYVMYYTAQTASGHGGHYCLSVATASSPRGPFTDSSGAPWLCMDSQGGIIDPSPFIDHAGHPWLLFKTYDLIEHGSEPALIYAVRLTGDGLHAANTPSVVINQRNLSSPFETIENPQMIFASGTYVMVFSRGNWTGGTKYREGIAQCDTPAGPCHEVSTAILSTYAGVNSPGGGTMFQDPVGRWYLAYDGWNAPCTTYSGSSCARQFYVSAVQMGLRVPCHAVAPIRGYRFAASDGGVFVFGNEQFCGSTGALSLNAPIVGMATTHNAGGYWLVASDGGMFSFGNAGFYGSTGGHHLNQPIVGMAATPSGHGYWLVARDGGIFAFGDAKFHGSTGSIHLNQPIVGMAATPSGRGYWLVARDGGIFAFGDAKFHGSTGSIHLNQPIVGMAASRSGAGYWLVARDGGIFAFGDAKFHGSTGSIHLNQPIVGMMRTPTGKGYWFVAADGGIFAYGDAKFHGSTGSIHLNHPIVAMG